MLATRYAAGAGAQEENGLPPTLPASRPMLETKAQATAVDYLGGSILQVHARRDETTAERQPLLSHYTGRPANTPIAAVRYMAPKGTSPGLQMKCVTGSNGRGKCVLWHPETGRLVYAAGQLLVVEELGEALEGQVRIAFSNGRITIWC